MAEIELCQESLDTLCNRVVVVTGGAQGIGLAIVQQLYHIGSIVVFGDRSVPQGQSVATSLTADVSKNLVQPTFLEVDVSSYQSVLQFFQRSLGLHGRVDCVIHAAAITERPGWLLADLSMELAAKCPPTDIFQINLLGSFYVCHIALAAMRQGQHERSDKSIVLLSSVAGFKDTPGLFAYSATKHGIIGLMRSARTYLPEAFNVRINVVCPWATDTPMFGSVHPWWAREGLPLNTADQVARLNLELAGNPRMNGKALYVAGGKAVDIDEGINRLESEWLGAQNALDLAKGQEVLALGATWNSKEAGA